jgi:hypothetical protein
MEGLQEAKAQVRSHPKHELILPMRKKIWRAMGPVVIGERNRAVVTTGLRRRTMLAVCATEHVLPIWEQSLSTKDPHEMLDTAQRYLRGEVDWDSAWETKNSFSGGLKNANSDEWKEIGCSICVGYAAVRTMGVALKDEWMDGDETLDEDRDDWDAGFFACAAFSGAPWGTNSDPRRRLQFWEWYIDDAVPQAYSGWPE